MQNKKLPPKVHEKGGRYYFVDRNKWHKLSRVDEGFEELYRTLSAQAGELPGSMAGIFSAYTRSADFQELAEPTRKQYSYFYFGILHHRFGHQMPAEITQATIARYMQLRKEDGAPIAGNRERAALSSAFNYAMRKGLAASNPCPGVRRNKEKPSKVLIESKSLSAAIDRAPPHMARLMAFDYLTGVRMTEAIDLEVSAVTPAGIAFVESKTGKPRLIEWSPVLRELVREILEARHAINTRVLVKRGASEPGRVDHERLFTNRFGKPLTVWGITSCMRRLEVDWSFRSIRPKAQTDAGSDRNVLGHSGQMREVYTRAKKTVPTY